MLTRSFLWQGFDEYMNLVLDEAEEMSIKKKSRKPLGELPLERSTLQAPWLTTLTLCNGREDFAEGRQHYTHDERSTSHSLRSRHVIAPRSAPAKHTSQRCSVCVCVLILRTSYPYVDRVSPRASASLSQRCRVFISCEITICEN